jgi:hypothetical protein
VVTAISIKAQTTEPQKQTADVQELKDKVKQLEQTVTELKDQLDALQEVKKNPKPAILEATYTPGAVASADKAPAKAGPDGSAVPAKSAKPDDPQGESTFEVYGFAMLDAGYDFGPIIRIGSTR